MTAEGHKTQHMSPTKQWDPPATLCFATGATETPLDPGQTHDQAPTEAPASKIGLPPPSQAYLLACTIFPLDRQISHPHQERSPESPTDFDYLMKFSDSWSTFNWRGEGRNFSSCGAALACPGWSFSAWQNETSTRTRVSQDNQGYLIMKQTWE
jgi:hypothetical protein